MREVFLYAHHYKAFPRQDRVWEHVRRFEEAPLFAEEEDDDVDVDGSQQQTQQTPRPVDRPFFDVVAVSEDGGARLLVAPADLPCAFAPLPPSRAAAAAAAAPAAESLPPNSRQQHHHQHNAALTTLYRAYSVTVLLDVRPSLAAASDGATGAVFFDQLGSALEACLRALAQPMAFADAGLRFAPDVLVNVAAVGEIEDSLEVLTQGTLLASACGGGGGGGVLPALLQNLRRQLLRVENKMARIHNDPTRRRRRQQQPQSQQDVRGFLRTALFTLKASFQDTCPAVICITDGVLALEESPAYEGLITRMNHDDLPLVFVKLGPPAPPVDSVVGLVPDVETIRFLAKATGGAYFDSCEFLKACEPVTRSAVTATDLQRVVLLKGSSKLGEMVDQPREEICEVPNSPDELPNFRMAEEEEGADLPLKLVKARMCEYSQTFVNLRTVIELRTSEGFAVVAMERTYKMCTYVALVLTWSPEVKILYEVTTARPSSQLPSTANLKARQPTLHISISVLAPYDFLCQLASVFKSSASSMMPKAQNVSAQRLAGFLSCIEETDRAVLNISFPLPLPPPSEQAFWKTVNRIQRRSLRHCVKTDKISFGLLCDLNRTSSATALDIRNFKAGALQLLGTCASWSTWTHPASAQILARLNKDDLPALPLKLVFAIDLSDHKLLQAASFSLMRPICILNADWDFPGVITLHFAFYAVPSCQVSSVLGQMLEILVKRPVAAQANVQYNFLSSEYFRSVIVSYKHLGTSLINDTQPHPPPSTAASSQSGGKPPVQTLPVVTTPLPSPPVLFSFMCHRRWVWTIPRISTSFYILNVLAGCRIFEGLKLLSTGVFTFYKQLVVRPTVGFAKTGSQPTITLPSSVQYSIYLGPPCSVITELWMEPQSGHVIFGKPPNTVAWDQQSFFFALADWFSICDSFVTTAVNTFYTLEDLLTLEMPQQSPSSPDPGSSSISQQPTRAQKGRVLEEFREPVAKPTVIDDGAHAIYNQQPALDIMSITPKESCCLSTFRGFAMSNAADGAALPMVEANTRMFSVLGEMLSVINEGEIPLSSQSGIPPQYIGGRCFASTLEKSIVITFLLPNKPDVSEFTTAFHIANKPTIDDALRFMHETNGQLAEKLAVVLSSNRQVHDRPAQNAALLSQYIAKLRSDHNTAFIRGLYTNLRDGFGCSLSDFMCADAVFSKESEKPLDITKLLALCKTRQTESRQLSLRGLFNARIARLFSEVPGVPSYFFHAKNDPDSDCLGKRKGASGMFESPLFLGLHCLVQTGAPGAKEEEKVVLPTLGDIFLLLDRADIDWKQCKISLVLDYMSLPGRSFKIPRETATNKKKKKKKKKQGAEGDAAAASASASAATTPSAQVEAEAPETLVSRSIRTLLKEAIAEEVLFQLRFELPFTQPTMERIRKMLRMVNAASTRVDLVFVDPRDGRNLFCKELQKFDRLQWVSETVCFMVWPAAEGSSRPCEIKHWLVVNVELDHATVKTFACEKESEAAIEESTQTVLGKISQARRVANQLTLLRLLLETRSCPSALVPRDKGDILAKNDPLEARGFAPGEFACELVHVMVLPYHDRLAPLKAPELLASDSKALLCSLAVSDRKLMFVYSANAPGSPTYYMRLYEQSPRSKSVAESPAGVVPPERLPAHINDGGNYLVLCVFGVSGVVQEIEKDLFEVLSKRLEGLTLQALTEALALNPSLRLSQQDINFVQPPGASPQKALVVGLPPGTARLPFVPFFDQHLSLIFKRLRAPLHTKTSGDAVASSVAVAPAATQLPFMDVVVPNKKSSDHALSFLHASVLGSGDANGQAFKEISLDGMDRCDLRQICDALTDTGAVAQYFAAKAWSLYASGEADEGPAVRSTPGLFVVLKIWSKGTVNVDALADLAVEEVKQAILDCILHGFLATVPTSSFSSWTSPINRISALADELKEQRPDMPTFFSRMKMKEVIVPSWSLRPFAVKLHALLAKMFSSWSQPPELLQSVDDGRVFTTVDVSVQPHAVDPAQATPGLSMLNKDNTMYAIVIEKHHPKELFPAPPQLSEEEWLIFPSILAASALAPEAIPRNCCLVVTIKSHELALVTYNLHPQKSQQLEEIVRSFSGWHRQRMSVFESAIYQKLGLFHAVKSEFRTIETVEVLVSDYAPKSAAAPPSQQQQPQQSTSQQPLVSAVARMQSPSLEGASTTTSPTVPREKSGGNVRSQQPHISTPFCILREVSFFEPVPRDAALLLFTNPVEKTLRQFRLVAKSHVRQRRSRFLCCALIHPTSASATQRSIERIDRTIAGMRLVHWCRVPWVLEASSSSVDPLVESAIFSSPKHERRGTESLPDQSEARTRWQAFQSHGFLTEYTEYLRVNTDTVPLVSNLQQQQQQQQQQHVGRGQLAQSSSPAIGSADAPPHAQQKAIQAHFYKVTGSNLVVIRMWFSDGFVCGDVLSYHHSSHWDPTVHQHSTTGPNFNALEFTERVNDLIALMHAKSTVYDYSVRAIFQFLRDEARPPSALVQSMSSSHASAATAAEPTTTTSKNPAHFNSSDFMHALLSLSSYDMGAQLQHMSRFREPPQYARGDVRSQVLDLPLRSGAYPLDVFSRLVSNAHALFRNSGALRRLPSGLMPAVALMLDQQAVEKIVAENQDALSLRGSEYCMLAFAAANQPRPASALTVIAFVVRAAASRPFPRKRRNTERRMRERRFLDHAFVWFRRALEAAVAGCERDLLHDAWWDSLAALQCAHTFAIAPEQFDELIASCSRRPMHEIDERGLAELPCAQPRALISSSGLPWLRILDAITRAFPEQARMLDGVNGVQLALFSDTDPNLLLHVLWDKSDRTTAISLCRRRNAENAENDRALVSAFVRAVLRFLLCDLSPRSSSSSLASPPSPLGFW